MHSAFHALHRQCLTSFLLCFRFFQPQILMKSSYTSVLPLLFSCSCTQGNSADFSVTLAQPKNFTCGDSLWILAYDSKPGCLQNWGELFKTIESFGLSLLREIAGNKALYLSPKDPPRQGLTAEHCRPGAHAKSLHIHCKSFFPTNSFNEEMDEFLSTAFKCTWNSSILYCQTCQWF